LRSLYHGSLSDRTDRLLVCAWIAGLLTTLVGNILVRRRAKRMANTMQNLQRHQFSKQRT
ncbi:MAG TPA: hypothetical protein VFC07_03915, partial [Verrucomicrobiae bacterium]|nr:hypothetical protein [Verrucomicrobiae bacterium]